MIHSCHRSEVPQFIMISVGLPRVEAMVRPMSSVTSRMLAAAATLSLLVFLVLWDSMAVETVEKKFSTLGNYLGKYVIKFLSGNIVYL